MTGAASLFADQLVLLRGGGDLATGVAWRLTRAGFPVAVCELERPLAVRRRVALSSAIDEGEVVVEGLVARRCNGPGQDVVALARAGIVPVIVAATLDGAREKLGRAPSVVVDARLAKRNIDTTIGDAPIVVALGPGFTAQVDCHAVVETMRGHRLGRVLWSGAAEPDTGTPGEIGGHGATRVLRAPFDGVVSWSCEIGDSVMKGQVLGRVDGVGDRAMQAAVSAPFAGVVRGLIGDRRHVPRGLKIGDIDPRAQPSACFEISDKALAVGGGVLEAVLHRLARA